MLDVVTGRVDNELAVEELETALGKLNLTGTLYFGYPVITTIDEKIMVDALVCSREAGVVAFRLIGAQDAQSASDLLDGTYVAIETKLKEHRQLRDRTKLAVPLSVFGIVPDIGTASKFGADVVAPEQLSSIDFTQGSNPLSEELFEALNAAVEHVATVRPRIRRPNIKRADSKGAKILKIDSQIANLDKWQKRAALEMPDGPQRIRGLAGSGKTVVLALKAAYLHTRQPEWTIALTFYTQALYQILKHFVDRFVQEQAKDFPDPRLLKIMHAWGGHKKDGLMLEIAQTHGLSFLDFNSASEKYGMTKAFEGACSELLDQLRQIPEVHQLYDVVLIDEAQDMPQPFFEIVYMATKPPKRIVWAYDELQNLSDSHTPPPEELFGLDGEDRPRVTLSAQDKSPRQDVVLPVIYRNTPWALAMAHALGFGIYRSSLVQMFPTPDLWEKLGYTIRGNYTAGSKVTVERSSNASPKFFEEVLRPDDSVTCHAFDSYPDQYQAVADMIATNLTEDELQPTDILVVFLDPRTFVKDSAPLVEALFKKGIKAMKAGVTTDRALFREEGFVTIAHIYRAKGNEAPMVYVLDSECTAEALYGLATLRSKLFTAITRSRAWVRICGAGTRMKKLKAEFDKVVENDYKLIFTVPTAEELERIRNVHRDRSQEEMKAIKAKDDQVRELVRELKAGTLDRENLTPEMREELIKLLSGRE